MDWTTVLGLRTTLTCLAIASLGCGSSEGNPSGGGGATLASSGGSLNRGGQLNVNVGGGEEGPGCERHVTLQAVTLGAPAPFDLVIVADHSMSLAWSRDELSRGLRDLLTHVQGRQVRVFLLTPTQYGASSALARKALTGDPVVAWQDPVSGEGYEGAMTEYTQTCTDPGGVAIACPDPKGTVPYKVEGKWSFVMPEPIATLTPDMSAAAFAAEANAVQQAILAIGGTGAPEEQPLCTLARYVSQPAAQLPKNAVFLLISDEDDVSQPNDCLQGHESELRVSKVEGKATACSSSCDAYRYTLQGTRRWLRLPFTCAAFNDVGERIAGTDQKSWYNLDAVASCSEITPSPCTAAERATIQGFCDSGLTLAECSRECATQEIPCRVDLPDASIDACSASFDYDGKTWPNLRTYCSTGVTQEWGACSGGGVTFDYQESRSGTSSGINLTSGTTKTADIGAHFKAVASKAFGPAGYLLEGIVLDPAFSCALGAGQSYASNIASFIGDRSHLFPLCESYAPALDGALGFAQALIQTEFEVDLEEDEHVSEVIVIAADGTERKLPTSSYRPDAATKTLKIAPSALSESDKSLRVEITSDCRPVVH